MTHQQCDVGEAMEHPKASLHQVTKGGILNQRLIVTFKGFDNALKCFGPAHAAIVTPKGTVRAST